MIQIKDICQLGRGRVINQNELYTHPGEYPVYSSQSTDGGAFGYLDTFDFEGEYVTWTTDGAYAGTVFHRSGRFNCTNVCGTLKAKANEICMKYIAYALSSRTKKHVSYVGNPKLMNNVMANIVIPFPPFLEQRRIAEILDIIDEAIQKTEALISKLKAMKQGLLHDLLTRGLDKNGKLRDPKAHPEQFKDSPLGRIPREWNVVSIGEIASHVGSGLTPRGGSEVYKTSGVIFIRSQNVTFKGLKFEDIAFIDFKTHEQMQRSEVFAHDVLINITGASIGRCCPLPKGLGPTNVNQHVCAIRLPAPRRKDAFYLSAVLASHIGQHQIDVLNAGGNREGLNYQQLRSFVIPWPEKDERTKAANIIAAHDARIRTEEQYRDKLKLQKKGLMHDLLTGKVRVNTEEVDA
ncbi:unnamed protein product [marine sediment metagenome]|uniref:Type I restriction modification DNA specificity domain-containing protein n=1 Tax=marine sediment metagenome TaxID=412755 RepID=X0T8X1_9ZZZZ